MRLQISCQERSHVNIIRLAGDFVMGAECQAIAQQVQQLLQQNKVAILLNLGQLRFIDSSGVGELLACFAQVQKHDGEFKLCEAQGMVRKVLKLTRTDLVVDTFDSEEAGWASFGVPEDRPDP